MAYREKVKEVLRDKLRRQLFRQEDDEGNIFYKVEGYSRDILTITLNETTFEVFRRCQPLKEGWWRQTYSYTYKNIEGQRW